MASKGFRPLIGAAEAQDLAKVRRLIAAGADVNASDEFGVIAMEAGRIAFRAVNGEFLSVAEGRGNEILANAPAIGASEAFEVVDLGGGRMLLRTSSGGYISVDAGGGLTVVTSRRAADTLSMRPICGGNRREA